MAAAWVPHPGEASNWGRLGHLARRLRMRLGAALEPAGPAAGLGTPWNVGPDGPLAASVTGHLSSQSGLGRSSRALIRALEHHGVEIRTVDIDQATTPEALCHATQVPFNIVHLNADAMRRTHARLGPAFYERRCTIGYWYWELSQFRDDWRHAFRYVDEVWVASRFVRDTLEPWAGGTPVMHLPPPVEPPAGAPLGRDAFGLPGQGVLFLYVFDAASEVARKNPGAVIEAFHRACLHPRAHLVIKVGNERDGSWRGQRHPGVTVLDRPLGDAELGALFSLADCYVSLHRAEGFGLTVAEAMAAGRPVISTDYGGVTDFVDAEVGWPVPWREAVIHKDAGPYLAGWRWAEPDLDAAATAMREVVEFPVERQRRGGAAARRMRMSYSVESTGAALVARLRTLRAER